MLVEMEEMTMHSQARSQVPSQRSVRSHSSQRSAQSHLEPPPLKPLLKPKGEWTLLRQFETELSAADQVSLAPAPHGEPPLWVQSMTKQYNGGREGAVAATAALQPPPDWLTDYPLRIPCSFRP